MKKYGERIGENGSFDLPRFVKRNYDKYVKNGESLNRKSFELGGTIMTEAEYTRALSVLIKESKVGFHEEEELISFLKEALVFYSI